mmetsp:Transcript_43995/g.139565  ORF Transcript_43995/g.139565 Transcript_43995/m.139565 type:complete len:205 (+) Transcript_43995:716-1330(+)
MLQRVARVAVRAGGAAERQQAIGEGLAVPQSPELTTPPSCDQGCAQCAWNKVEQCRLPHLHNVQRHDRHTQSEGIADDSEQEVAPAQRLPTQHVEAQQEGDQQSGQGDVPEAKHAVSAKGVADGGDAHQHGNHLARAAACGDDDHDALREEEGREEHPEDVEAEHEGQQPSCQLQARQAQRALQETEKACTDDVLKEPAVLRVA